MSKRYNASNDPPRADGCELLSLCAKFVSGANRLAHVFDLAAFANS